MAGDDKSVDKQQASHQFLEAIEAAQNAPYGSPARKAALTMALSYGDQCRNPQTGAIEFAPTSVTLKNQEGAVQMDHAKGKPFEISMTEHPVKVTTMDGETWSKQFPTTYSDHKDMSNMIEHIAHSMKMRGVGKEGIHFFDVLAVTKEYDANPALAVQQAQAYVPPKVEKPATLQAAETAKAPESVEKQEPEHERHGLFSKLFKHRTEAENATIAAVKEEYKKDGHYSRIEREVVHDLKKQMRQSDGNSTLGEVKQVLDQVQAREEKGVMQLGGMTLNMHAMNQVNAIKNASQDLKPQHIAEEIKPQVVMGIAKEKGISNEGAHR